MSNEHSVIAANGEVRWMQWTDRALLDERVGRTWSPTLETPIDWTGATFLFANHLGLTKDPMFADNVLFLLLEKN